MPSMLRYAVMTERREGLVRDLPDGHEGQRWVANAAVLIEGDVDAVLVDTFATIEQNQRLIDWIRHRGKNLAAVYLTHGHGDHAFGVGQLRSAFPGARFLATPGTIAQLAEQAGPPLYEGFWQKLFPGQIPPVLFPDALETASILIEDHEARVIETGHTDGPDSTVLWVPDAGLIAGGDVVYNRTYPYLAESTPHSRASWIETLTRLKTLEPRYVVSAHKDPRLGDSPSDIDATIGYLESVAAVERASTDALDFYRQMLARYPDWINIGSLWGAAKTIWPQPKDSM